MAAALRSLRLALCVCALALLLAPPATRAADDGLPYHEWGEPTGAFAGKPPLGYVLVVHGGAWLNVGPSLVEAARYKADEFRARGWATLNTTYGAGARSVDDVAAMAELLRRRAGPDAPVCLWGGSAGGHLALLAAARASYDCVITEAGPTDLVSVQHQTAAGSVLGPVQGYLRALLVFGLDGLWRNSPVRVASQIGGRLLMATAATDPFVPLDQMAEMKAARPATRTLVLEGGQPSDAFFVHAFITRPAQAQLAAAVDATLDGARRDVAARLAGRDAGVRIAPRTRGAWFSSLLPVSVAAGAGISRVELRVDGHPVAADSRRPFAFAYRPSRRLGLGRHRLRAVGFAGGRQTSASTIVRRVSARSLRAACRSATRSLRSFHAPAKRRSARLLRDRRCPPRPRR